MRVFLDVGSHVGETIAEVAEPKYGFERIVCFEPSLACLDELNKLAVADDRIEICPFGLSDRTMTVKLANAGTLGGSVFATGGEVETVELVDAAQWFRDNLDPEDLVVVKTNCEGSEVDILNRLLDQGLLERATTFLVTFDIRDYPEHRHKEIEVRRRLAASGLANYCFSDDVMIGTTHEKRLAHWLHLFGIDRPELSVADVRRIYGDKFRRYAAKSGKRERLEQSLKERFGYSALPEPIKAILRGLKRLFGLSRERDLSS